MNDRIEAFLTFLDRERGVSANTLSAYRNDLRQFEQFMAAEAARERQTPLPLAMVDRERLGGFLLWLRERDYAPATLARKIAAMRSFFHYLHRNGEIASNPTEGLGSPEVKKTPPHSISARDVQRLFQRAKKRQTPEALRDLAMLRVLWSTGIRVGELVMLDLTDLDLQNRTLRVVGRGGRARVLPLDPSTAVCLQEYLANGRPAIAQHPAEVAVFLNHRGQRLTRQGFWLILKALVKESGLPATATPHTLRHSFAAHRLGSGTALEELRQLLGHASITTTQMYARTTAVAENGHTPEPADDAAEHTLVPAAPAR